jgi:pimeloyl-ACP methyl ester carboxylesterase
MPYVQANNLEIYYEVQGEGEPLVLIPYLAADQACYAFQVADYAKRFTCYTVDLRGAGLSGKPEGTYSTQLFADDVAAFMRAVGITSAHVSGLSLGAATGVWLAGKYPDLVKSLSLHSCWTATDPYLRVVVQGWQTMAKALDSTTEMAIQGIFPWCLTPELYASKPEYIDSLADFVRSRPMPPVDAFLRQSDAVLAHDAAGMLGLITAPTQITFGQFDAVTSVRFAGPLTEAIKGSELVVFEGCSHAPIYENVADFNARTMDFLTRNS